MMDRPGREMPKLAFGCLAVIILVAVAASVFAVIFIWDVNAL